MKTAIVLGATGLTGSFLLRLLLKDKRYSKIIVFTRKKLGMEHPKLEQHHVELFDLEDYEEKFKADVVFCCVGSTRKKTPKKKIYKKVDYGIPVMAAELCKKNSIPTLLIISALGANPKAKLFYLRIKGEMERDVLKMKIPNTYFFRPSIIGGEREENRRYEFFAKQVMEITSFLHLGPLKKFRPIHPESIAKAMLQVAEKGFPRPKIKSFEIQEIADHA